MATRLLNVVITGDVKGALAGFSELEAGAATAETSVVSRFNRMGLFVGAALGAAGVAAGVALYKIGNDFAEAYEKISSGTGKTGKALSGLEDIFKQVVTDVPTDFGRATDAITQLVSGLGLSGPALRKVSDDVLELSRLQGGDVKETTTAVTQLMNNWSVATRDQSKELDTL